MTTRRDVLIGMAGVAAAAAVPIKAIAEPIFEFHAQYPGVMTTPHSVTIVHNGSEWCPVDVFINGHRLYARALEAGKEYTAVYRDGTYHVEET